MSINASISEYLRVKGISQSELARKLDTNQPNLNRILKSNDMKLSLFLQICKELELSPSFFLDNEKQNVSQKVLSELDNLKEDIRRRVEYEELANLYITDRIDSHYNLKISNYIQGIDELNISQITKEELKEKLVTRAKKEKIKFKEEYKGFISLARKFVESNFSDNVDQVYENCKKEIDRLLSELIN